MIDASSSSLGEFLKSKGVQTAAAGADVAASAGSLIKPASPVEPLNNAVTNTTDSLEKFTNLLESVNKLINSPLVSGVLNKGVERKAGNSAPKDAEVVEVPPGYNPPNVNGGDTSGGLPPPTPPKEEPQKVDKREKAAMFYAALLKAVEEMKNKDAKRTIEEIYEELAQEVVKEQLINQFEVLV